LLLENFQFQKLMQNFFSVFKKNMFWVLVFLVVFIPLYPKFPFANIPGTYVAIRLEDLVIGITILIWFTLNAGKLKSYFKKTIYQAILLFWVIGGLSLLSAIWVSQSVQPHLGLLHWVRRIEYMSLFIVAATSIESVKQVKILIWAFLATVVLVVLYGFGQIWLDFPVVSTTNKEFSKGLILYLTKGARVSSTFAGHYDLAIFLSMALMVIAGLFFYYKGFVRKLGFLAMGAGSFILLGLTAARVSFVATFIGLAAIFWLNKKRWLVLGLMVVCLGVLAAVPDLRHRLVATVTVNLMGGGGAKYNPPPGTVTVYTPIKHVPESSRAQFLKNIKESTPSATESGAIAYDTAPGEPINTTELGVYRSFGIRTNVEWPRAINAFYKNPLLGTGYSSITLATDNDIVRSFGEVGILGTFALGLVFLILVKEMASFRKVSNGFENLFILGLLGSIFVFFATALFIDVLEASKIAEIFWLMLGVSWATMKGYKND